MEFTAEQIAGLLNGEVHGVPGVTVNTLAKIEEGHLGALSFLSNPKYEEFIYTTRSTVCIVNKTFTPSKALPDSLTLIKVDDAYQCFAKLLELYAQMNRKTPEIESPSFISDSAKIGANVYIGAFAYIGKNVHIADEVQIFPNCYIGDNVQLGRGSILHPGVSVYHDCKVGENCIIHAGTVLGADGFGFAPDADGVFHKVPQIGNVVVEDNVEIGSNTTIDRATMGSTIIKKGVKIDNLCQIAHNVEIGYNSALAAQVGVAGSAKIGERVMVGGQAGISGHLHIANDTKIVAQSGIPSTVKKPDTLMGSPGIPLEDFKKSYFGFRKLPFILNKLQELEKKIKELTQNNEPN